MADVLWCVNGLLRECGTQGCQTVAAFAWTGCCMIWTTCPADPPMGGCVCPVYTLCCLLKGCCGQSLLEIHDTPVSDAYVS